MAIDLYTGTPGSGKSLDVARLIRTRLRMKNQTIMATFDLNLAMVNDNGKKDIGRFIHIPIQDLSPQLLYTYAYRNHVKGKEGQTLVVIDECQIIFNPMDFGSKENNKRKLEWVNFFTQHRHLGYSFILVTQFDRLIHRQIRCLVENEVKHRKLNNWGLLFALPFKFFAKITIWYGVKAKVSSEMFLYNKKLGQMYDSYTQFDTFLEHNKIDPADEEMYRKYIKDDLRGRVEAKPNKNVEELQPTVEENESFLEFLELSEESLDEEIEEILPSETRLDGDKGDPVRVRWWKKLHIKK